MVPRMIRMYIIIKMPKNVTPIFPIPRSWIWDLDTHIVPEINPNSLGFVVFLGPKTTKCTIKVRKRLNSTKFPCLSVMLLIWYLYVLQTHHLVDACFPDSPEKPVSRQHAGKLDDQRMQRIIQIRKLTTQDWTES